MSKSKKPIHTPSDFGTRERLQHTEGIAYENVDKRLGSPKRMRVTVQTPLDRYYSREQITRRQFEAGMKLMHCGVGQGERKSLQRHMMQILWMAHAETMIKGMMRFLIILLHSEPSVRIYQTWRNGWL